MRVFLFLCLGNSEGFLILVQQAEVSSLSLLSVRWHYSLTFKVHLCVLPLVVLRKPEAPTLLLLGLSPGCSQAAGGGVPMLPLLLASLPRHQGSGPLGHVQGLPSPRRCSHRTRRWTRAGDAGPACRPRVASCEGFAAVAGGVGAGVVGASVTGGDCPGPLPRPSHRRLSVLLHGRPEPLGPWLSCRGWRADCSLHCIPWAHLPCLPRAPHPLGV